MLITVALSALADVGLLQEKRLWTIADGIPEDIYQVSTTADIYVVDAVATHRAALYRACFTYRTQNGLRWAYYAENSSVQYLEDNTPDSRDFFKFYDENQERIYFYWLVDPEYYYGRTNDVLFEGFKETDLKDGFPTDIFNATDMESQARVSQAIMNLVDKYHDVVGIFLQNDCIDGYYYQRGEIASEHVEFEGGQHCEYWADLNWFRQYKEKIPYTRFFYYVGSDAGGDDTPDDLSAKKGTMPATIDGKTIDVGYVQLWDHGPRFAVQNVGATSPTDFGGYYTWCGHESMVRGEQWSNGKDLQGTIYDTAIKLWGENWQMPTQLQMNQLIQNCDAQWVDNYQGTGVAGCIFTGRGEYADNQIFLPAAGYYGHWPSQGLARQNQNLYYWTSTPNDWDGLGNPEQQRAYLFRYRTTGASRTNEYYVEYAPTMYSGYSVRPIVRIPTKTLPVLPVDLSLSPAPGSSLVMLRSVKVNNVDCSFDNNNVEFDVKNASGEVVAKAHLQEYYGDGYTFAFDKTILEVGDYSLVIPEGSYAIEKNGKLYTNAAIDYRFSIYDNQIAGTCYFPDHANDINDSWVGDFSGLNITTAASYAAFFDPEYVDIVYPDGAVGHPSANGISMGFMGGSGQSAPYKLSFSLDRYKQQKDPEYLRGEYRVIYHPGALMYYSRYHHYVRDFVNEELTRYYYSTAFEEPVDESLKEAYDEMLAAYNNYIDKYNAYEGNSPAIRDMNEGLDEECYVARNYSNAAYYQNYYRSYMSVSKIETVQEITKRFVDAANTIDEICSGNKLYDALVTSLNTYRQYVGYSGNYLYEYLSGRELQAEYFNRYIFHDADYMHHCTWSKRGEAIRCYNLDDLKALKEKYENWYNMLKFYERHYLGYAWDAKPEYEKFESMVLKWPVEAGLKGAKTNTFTIHRVSDDAPVAVATFTPGVQYEEVTVGGDDGYGPGPGMGTGGGEPEHTELRPIWGSFGLLTSSTPITEMGYYYIDFPDEVFTADDGIPNSEIRYTFGVNAGHKAAAGWGTVFDQGKIKYSVTYGDFLNDRNTVEVLDITANPGDRIEIPAYVTYNGGTFAVTNVHLYHASRFFKARYVCFPPTLKSFTEGYAPYLYDLDEHKSLSMSDVHCHFIFTSPEPPIIDTEQRGYDHFFGGYDVYVSKDVYDDYLAQIDWKYYRPDGYSADKFHVIDPALMPEKAHALETAIEKYRATLDDAGILDEAEGLLDEMDKTPAASNGMHAPAADDPMSIAHIKYLMDRADELCDELAKYCFVRLDADHRLADYIVTEAHGYGTGNNIHYVRIRGELQEDDVNCMQNYFNHAEAIDLRGATFAPDVMFRTAMSADLKELRLPASLTALDNYSMPWHVGTTDIFLYHDGVVSVPDDFNGVEGFIYYVPDEVLNLYKQHPVWKNADVRPMTGSPAGINAPTFDGAAAANSAARKFFTPEDGVIIVSAGQHFSTLGVKK